MAQNGSPDGPVVGSVGASPAVDSWSNTTAKYAAGGLPSTGSPLPHILLPIAQIVALAAPPFKGRTFLFSHLILGLAYLAHTNQFTSDPGVRYALACVWPYYMGTLGKLLFTEPEKTYWRLDRPEQEATKMAGWSLAKFRWAAALLANNRGISWSHQTKGVPPHYPGTLERGRFILRRLRQLVVSWLILDAAAVYANYMLKADYEANPLTVTYRDDRLWASFLNGVIQGITPFFLMQFQYSIAALFTVTLGICAPKDWPPFYGDLRDMITVRYLWGGFWHQMLRNMFNFYTTFLIKFFGFKRGTNFSAYTQLYISFFISGALHALSTFLLPAPAGLSTLDRWWPTLKYFQMQALAIHAEDCVIAVWKRFRGTENVKSEPALWQRVIGHAWVVAWLWYCLPIGSDVFLRSGLALQASGPPGPFTAFFGPI